LYRGLFIGRFQPFHLGHLAAIKFALRNVEELIIVIGSAEKSHEMRNPFTAGERIEMIKSSLDADSEIDVRKIFIIPVPDINIHSLWTHQVDVLVPKYKSVFTNDPFTCILFREKGTKVIEPTLHQREVLSATEVRSRMIEDGDWKKLVTFQTVKVIEDIHGIRRIKSIFAKYLEISYKVL
jgi:nicotinamide-nucleotide adenylyltransferase